MKSAGKARNNGLYRHIRTSKEIIRNLLNDYMKKKIAQFITKFGGTMAAFAVMVAALTANSACLWLTHQPEEPDEIKQLKK